MDLSIKQIQYKTNKYFTKYNNSSDPVGKLIYARKYLFYVQNNLEQIGGAGMDSNSNPSTQEHINQMLQSINEQVKNIQSHIEKFKPTFELVEKFDNTMRTNLSKDFKGYTKTSDLVDYYLNIVSECKELL